MAVGNTDDIGHGIDGTESVGNMVDGHNTGLGREETFVGFKVENSLVAEGDGVQRGASELPWDDIGVVFHARDYHLVVASEVATREGGCHKVDALGGATGKDNLVMVAGLDERLHLTAHRLISFGSLGGQMMGSAMDVAIERTIVAVESLDDPQRLLGGGSIVEIDQRMSVDGDIKDGKLGAEIVVTHVCVF